MLRNYLLCSAFKFMYICYKCMNYVEFWAIPCTCYFQFDIFCFCLIAHTQWKSDVTSSEHLARTSLKSLSHLRIGSHTFALRRNPRVMAMENARICTMCVNQHHSNTEGICVCKLVWSHDFYSVLAWLLVC